MHLLLAKKQSLPILNVLDLTRLARAGLELMIFHLLSESTTTRLHLCAMGTLGEKDNTLEPRNNHIYRQTDISIPVYPPLFFQLFTIKYRVHALDLTYHYRIPTCESWDTLTTVVLVSIYTLPSIFTWHGFTVIHAVLTTRPFIARITFALPCHWLTSTIVTDRVVT
jgi:hypothetical protein